MNGLTSTEWLAIVIPLAAIQLGLMIWAFVDLAHRQRVKGGSRLLWVFIILILNIIGPVLYLVWGRNE